MYLGSKMNKFGMRLMLLMVIRCGVVDVNRIISKRCLVLSGTLSPFGSCSQFLRSKLSSFWSYYWIRKNMKLVLFLFL